MQSDFERGVWSDILRHGVGLLKALFRFSPNFEREFREKLDK